MQLSRRTSFLLPVIPSGTDRLYTNSYVYNYNEHNEQMLTVSVYVASVVHLCVPRSERSQRSDPGRKQDLSPAALLQVSYFALEEFFLTRSRVWEQRVSHRCRSPRSPGPTTFVIWGSKYISIWFDFEAFLMVWGFEEHLWGGFNPYYFERGFNSPETSSASAWLSCGVPQGLILVPVLVSWLSTSCLPVWV